MPVSSSPSSSLSDRVDTGTSSSVMLSGCANPVCSSFISKGTGAGDDDDAAAADEFGCALLDGGAGALVCFFGVVSSSESRFIGWLDPNIVTITHYMAGMSMLLSRFIPSRC